MKFPYHLMTAGNCVWHDIRRRICRFMEKRFLHCPEKLQAPSFDGACNKYGNAKGCGSTYDRTQFYYPKIH